jgi:hypothetical protein
MGADKRWIDWLNVAARVVAGAAIIYSQVNGFVVVVRSLIVFQILFVVCVGALALSLINMKNRRFLQVAAAAGGLYYLGKLIVFSLTDWVLYLISPASVTQYHVPALLFTAAMIYPWLPEKQAGAGD